jgi:hypothetical protein
MRRAPFSFEQSVGAFRDLTADPGDGAPTRARVLARAGRQRARRAWLRRLAAGAAAALLAVSSAAAAWTLAAQRLRAPATVSLEETVAAPSPGGGAGTRRSPQRVMPPERAPSPPAGGEPSDRARQQSEEQAYAAAHRAHFGGGPPARALVAWNGYLAAFPRGVFAPEARFNRALCLIHLGRFGEARRALRPFADGGGYRRADARALLDWLPEGGPDDGARGREPRR